MGNQKNTQSSYNYLKVSQENQERQLWMLEHNTEKKMCRGDFYGNDEDRNNEENG